ncbi:hypothetical protein HRI_001658800 [Hibiscus trionum]|uniref:Uncharacterized protein n=1 Tax=Hibiscus trionum TaxID=183268 RepID=A0A9W7LYS9_HIBTR|nr:hypothetical protein HRI_001658800 [Hibiscus trionum]
MVVTATSVLEESEPSETTVKGWEEQRAEVEVRMTGIESKLEETNSRLEANNTLMANLLKAVADKVGEPSPTPVKHRSTSVNDDNQNKGEGKKPIEVTILSDKEKYTFKPEEPGIFGARPDDVPRYNN